MRLAAGRSPMAPGLRRRSEHRVPQLRRTVLRETRLRAYEEPGWSDSPGPAPQTCSRPANLGPMIGPGARSPEPRVFLPFHLLDAHGSGNVVERSGPTKRQPHGFSPSPRTEQSSRAGVASRSSMPTRERRPGRSDGWRNERFAALADGGKTNTFGDVN